MATEQSKRDPKDTLRLILIVTICIVWAGSWVAKLLIKEYEAPAGIDVAFSLVCGYLLVTYNKNNSPADGGDGEEPSREREEIER